jgi:hypothetical protein
MGTDLNFYTHPNVGTDSNVGTNLRSSTVWIVSICMQEGDPSLVLSQYACHEVY